MNASAANMESVYKAKQHHDANCPFGGIGIRVCIHPYDLDRLGWDEGDNIAGLIVVSDTSVNTGMLRVECDAERDYDGMVDVEAVSKTDLVPA